MLKLVGILFYIIGIADFAGMFLGYDFTGQFWTPILFGALGQFFFSLSDKINKKNDADAE